MRKTTLQDDIKRIIALHRELLERHSRQGEIIDGLPSWLSSLESVIREWGIEVSRSMERIEGKLERLERAVLLIYGKQEHSLEGRQIFNTIRMEHGQTELTRQLAQQIKNLNKYKEQIAIYGNVPPVYLLNLVEETEQEIARLKDELDD